MKTKVWAMMLGLLILAACEEKETSAESWADTNFLSVGVDGDTDLLLTEMNAYFSVSATSLTDEVEAGLLLMREEEKMAHDLYVEFDILYDLRVFSNISASEANHMEAMLQLLEAFSLEDPASPDAGVFQNENLQATYNELLSKGEVSLVAALESGAYVEELDILDLERLLEGTSDENITLVYSNLLSASRNHLRAFNRVLEANGVEYVPQLLSQSYFDEIVNAEMERGGHRNQHAYGYANSCGQGGKN